MPVDIEVDRCGLMLTLSDRSESLYLKDPHFTSSIGRHLSALETDLGVDSIYENI